MRPVSIAAALLLLPLAACDLLDQLDEPAGCLPATPALDLSGAWWITGTGNRTDCDDELDDGDVDFRTPRGVQVVQASASDGTLSLEAPGSLGQFTFGGRIDGDCVHFTTGEGGAADQSFDFVGTAEQSYSSGASDPSFDRDLYPQRVLGRFRSEGPGSCVSTGTFKVEIRN